MDRMLNALRRRRFARGALSRRRLCPVCDSPCLLGRVIAIQDRLPHRRETCVTQRLPTGRHLYLSVMTSGIALMFLDVPAFAGAPLSYLRGYGQKADTVAWLTWGVLVISLAVTVIIALLLVAAIWHGHNAAIQNLDGAQTLARPVGGLNWIWIGVGLSSLVLLFSIVWTLRVLARVSAPPVKPALTIEITGRQWWWQVRYLSDDPARVFATANEIHIPVGVPVQFRLIGGDVIHSFWVPALSGKTDMIPGQTNELWLDAHEPGVYRGQCGEYCGVEHAHMGFLVVAQTPAAFRAWWDHQLQSPLSAADGQLAVGAADFNAHCGSCHAVRGTDAAGVLGPDLSHLMTRRTIAAAMLSNNPTNLARWIRDPQGVKPGNMMQAAEISPTELTGILTYLQTLN